MNKYKEALKALEAHYKGVEAEYIPSFLSKAIDVLHESDEWEPENEETIWIWDSSKCNRIKGRFVGMYFGMFICRVGSEFISMPYAEPIPKRPWIKHDGKSWPDCLPGDRVEVTNKAGGTMVRQASKARWSHNDGAGDITAWRLAE